MKSDLKKQKRQSRSSQKKQQRMKIAIVSVLAVAALAWAASSYTPSSSSSAAALSPSEGFRRITVDEMKEMYDGGNLTVIDVRDPNSYLQSHIEGALQIPLARVEGETPYLPKDKMIVTYCTCPNEETSGQAAQILAKKGFRRVAALKGGMAAWQREGYAMAAGMPPPRR